MLWSLRTVSGMAAIFVISARPTRHEWLTKLRLLCRLWDGRLRRLGTLPHVLDHDRRAEGREPNRRYRGAQLQDLALRRPCAVATLIDSADDLAVVDARLDARGVRVAKLEGDHAVLG